MTTFPTAHQYAATIAAAMRDEALTAHHATDLLVGGIGCAREAAHVHAIRDDIVAAAAAIRAQS